MIQTTAAAFTPEAEPIFSLLERTSCTTGHQPSDYEKLYYRGGQIRFVIRLARRPQTAVGAR